MGSEKIRAVPGIDAIDALLRSLFVGEERLKFDARSAKIKVTFMGDEDLGLYPKIHEPSEEDRDNDIDTSGFEEIFEEFFRNFKPEHPRSPTSDDQ
jgi:hypothetical protein